MEIGARHWLIFLAVSRKFGKNVIFCQGMVENNDFVLFILQVCAHVVTGMGEDFTEGGVLSQRVAIRILFLK